jgi:protein-tyrosine kinase
MNQQSRFGSVHDAQASEFPDTQTAKDGRSIGEIISEANSLSPEQIEQILAYQRENGVRFGEAAVALGLANTDDILWALSQQFHYPYASEGKTSLNPELVVVTRPFSEQAEAFRSIRSHIIMKLYSDAGPRAALAILSANSGDGKTYFAANLAAAFAQLPGRTLLIEADMRNPRLAELFNLPGRGEGLSSILSGRAASKVIQSVKELPVGPKPPNPLELLERPAMGMLLRELRTKFDRVIVDTPAAAQGTDGPVVAAKCGAALIIARQDKTRINDLQQVTRSVSMSSAQLIGTVVNEF